MKPRNRGVILALLPFLLMVLAFQLVPAVSMLAGSFRQEDGTGFTLGNYLHALQSAYYMQAIKNSLLISITSSLIGIAAGLLCAYCITRFTSRVRDRLLMLTNMTSNFAGVPLAFAYIILLGNNGVFTLLFKQWGWDIFGDFNLYSWSGLVLVYIYFQAPLALLLLYPSFYGIREQWREAAALLGAGRWQFWKTIGLPVLAPAIFGTLGILFANAMGAYATAYALVGGNYNLLAVRIGALVAGDVVTQPQMGSTLAVLLALTTLLAVYLNQRMARHAESFGFGPAAKTGSTGKASLRLRPAVRKELGQ
ncbi:ABC transporter permease subunit [Paenibacillus albidus]|uniref:ABC transporter permease n=1 Tax=Paenibacillus albidus TaxID=2041023 RepID=UPI001BE78376|nr:ABC transporter permease subunit [Paenibacillus albidus]MBT2288936.1 ABC transporter permease subunit [Paenibacillus albidus]